MSTCARKIFVLTGAGISAESGLGTFRYREGLWARYDPMKLATPQAFTRNPQEVHAFYNARREGLLQAKPNAAHQALGQLEAALTNSGGQLFLCTQNIDDLHERGGSQNVVHMHGELLKARCIHCMAVSVWRDDLNVTDACPACQRREALRPHVVWFGETPFQLDVINAALLGSDLFVAIGTSGAVYPAAGLVETASRAGIRTCEINLEPSDNARKFDDAHYGMASEAVPNWIADILPQFDERKHGQD